MSQASTPASPEAPALERDGRIVAIDILRGLAILWVISFHLWGDMTFKLGATSSLYVALRERLAEGRIVPALTALGEVVLGTGFHGVALFMVLSGLSLTLNAYRRGEPPILDGYRQRIWKLLPVYWSGIVFLAGTVAIVALLQLWLDGGSFAQQWDNVRIAVLAPVRIRVEDALWAASVVGWLFTPGPHAKLVASMWFVALLIQYYLVFPFAFRALGKFGPMRFMALALAITFVSRALLIVAGADWLAVGVADRTMAACAPFRFSEFAAGMTIGWLMVHKRSETAEYVASPFDIAGLIVIAFLLQMGGAVLGPKAETMRVFGDPAIALGMAIYALPLLFKTPGRLEVSLPAKALIFTGVISFPVLIVNDGMRYFASFLRYEGLPDPWWWLFLTLVYVPVGVLIAYPYARLFRLLPKQRHRAPAAREAAPAVAAPADLQPAGVEVGA